MDAGKKGRQEERKVQAKRTAWMNECELSLQNGIEWNGSKQLDRSDVPVRFPAPQLPRKMRD